MTNEIVGKSSKKWECKICDYITCRSDNYKKHLQSIKHKNKENTKLYEENTKNTNEKVGKVGKVGNTLVKNNWTCICGKEYKHASSLWNHKQKCIYIENEEESEENCEEIVEHKLDKELELKDMFLTVVNENKELRGMMVEQQKTIMEQSKQMTEIIPKIGNNNSTTNNNTINNNQRFSINVFLNEQCKDAINMSDFIKSISVSLEQLDFTKTQGLEKGISQVIMDNMNKLSLYERPMHCTDTKRETIYIKDNDKWEKDKTKEKLKHVIKKTSNKNYTALANWTKENPDYMEDDSKQMFYARAMSTLGKPIDNVEDKIVKKICSNTYLKESLENED